MSPILTCRCGHRWTAIAEDRELFCPQCGEPVRAGLPAGQAIAAEPRPILPALPRRWDDDDPPLRRVRRQPPSKSVSPNSNLAGIFAVVAVVVIFGLIFAA